MRVNQHRSAAALLAAMVLLGACGDTKRDRLYSGALIGAGSGAAVGALAGAPMIGAVVGTGVGLAVGASTTNEQLDMGTPVWR